MIAIERWGRVNYSLAHRKQKEYVAQILNEERAETLVLCSHPPVVTLGKSSEPSDLQGWNGQIYSVERGGRATYHGPGQILCYPLLDLQKRGRDLGGLLNALELSVVRALRNYGLAGRGNPTRGKSELSGVWVNNRKVASLGVAVKRRVSYHGLAVNLHREGRAFQGLRPCGLSGNAIASVEELLGHPLCGEDFEQLLVKELLPLLPQIAVESK